MNILTPCLAPIGGDREYPRLAPLDEGCSDDIAEIAVEIAALDAYRAIRAARIARVHLSVPSCCPNMRALLENIDGLIAGLRDDQVALERHSDAMGGAA